MKYQLCGDKVQLIRYEITDIRTVKTIDDNGNEVERELMTTLTAVSDAERDAIIERYPDAIVTEVDNTGYEYLDGEVFTQAQIANGELDAAIAMGAEAYAVLKNAPSQDEINAMLLLKVAELTAKLAEVKGNE